MSKKKFEHWCDNQYQEPTDTNKFVIGDLAYDIYKSLEEYLLHDINKDMMITFEDTTQGHISKNYVIKKMYKMIEVAEEIEVTVRDANSIYALYGIDYARRRQLWLESRGKCFQLIQYLSHITSIMVKGANIQKYVRLSSELYKLSDKIKNIMIADDKKKKDYCKSYLPQGNL